MTVYDFDVYGQPITQGSHRAIIPKGSSRPVVIQTNDARHRDWRNAVADAAKQARGEAPLLDGPVAVTLRFYKLRPKSHRGRTWMTGQDTGDIDKLQRAILDALTNTLWKDDAQVVSIGATKDYGTDPGVSIHVQTLPEGETVVPRAMATFITAR